MLKLWLAWKHHGDVGFASRIDHAVAMAAHASARITGSGGEFERVTGNFTNVIFGWIPPDLRPLDLSTQSIQQLDVVTHERLHSLAPMIKACMQNAGTAMMGFQPVAGLNTFRLLFMNPEVQTTDIDAMLDRVAQYGREMTTVA